MFVRKPCDAVSTNHVGTALDALGARQWTSGIVRGMSNQRIDMGMKVQI